LYEHRPVHGASLVSFEPSPKPVIADDVTSTRYVKERDVEIVDVDRAVDQLLDRVFLPCRQALALRCDNGGEQVPARIVFLHPDRGVAGVGLAEP
jgi:hypothetical protein